MENWKNVVGYEGHYTVSDLGNVSSIKKGVKRLKLQNGTPYSVVHLYKDGSHKSRTVHQLVAEAFLGHTPCGYKLVVDHINQDKRDNRLINLRIISQRENTLIRGGNKYVGVRWCSFKNKWTSRITINGHRISLGSFCSEEDAHHAYQVKLKSLCNGSPLS